MFFKCYLVTASIHLTKACLFRTNTDETNRLKFFGSSLKVLTQMICFSGAGNIKMLTTKRAYIKDFTLLPRPVKEFIEVTIEPLGGWAFKELDNTVV